MLRGSRPAVGKGGPEELHRDGILWLYHGDAARAVANLEAAVERKPSAEILSDLAAAYLAFAEEDRPWFRVDALAAATQAGKLAPNKPSPAFNLALALERLSLVHEASLAWDRYRALEEDSDWQREASGRLKHLSAPTVADRWKTEKDRLIAASQRGDRETAQRLVRQFTRQTKELLEGNLLLAWADAAGPPAESAKLATAKLIAEILAEDGEAFYTDVIRNIERRPKATPPLVQGQQAYARGLELRGNCPRALPEFEQAFRKLTAEDSPLAWAARYQQLVCLYRQRPTDAEQSLAQLAKDVEARRYPTLQARIEGMLGLCSMHHGQFSQAIAHYERAIDLLKGSGDTDVLNLLGMLDEAYRILGDEERAWRNRLDSLRGAVAAGDRRLRHAVLAGLSRDLIEKDRRDASFSVLSEMIANARAWPDPGAEAEALLRRIQLYLRNGSDDEAARDIDECKQLLESFQQSADREHLKTELMVVTAEQQLSRKPAEALKTIEAAVPRLEAGEDGLLLPQALLDLARARVSIGDITKAEEAFDQALRLYEDRRANTSDEEHRISFFSTAQASFDAMIRFQALERGDARAGFVYSEMARARNLRDHIKADDLNLDTRLAQIPPTVAFISYTTLPDALLIWRLQQGSLRMYVQPASRIEIVKIIHSLRLALSESLYAEPGRIVAARAFDLLLRPVLGDLPAETELVFSPDRELYSLPFSALLDSRNNHYVVQDHPSSVTPSLAIYTGWQKRIPKNDNAQLRVLTVGDPAFDNKKYPSLPALHHARHEAEEIAKLYPKGIALVGKAATRQSILEHLPGHDVVHIAAHVVIDQRSPLDSSLATADVGRPPLRASDLNTKLLSNIRLIFLSACSTGPGFADGDREGVSGLARVFLISGVPTVVATQWFVDDQATYLLTTRFHAHLLQGQTPASALRWAQVFLLSQDSTPPFAWAPFQVIYGTRHKEETDGYWN